MTIRENMARNLRHLTKEKGSVAEVCRDIGVNRQQFNKYLAGQSLPNKSTLRKICEYFEVDESELVIEFTFDPSTHAHSAESILALPAYRQIIGNISVDPPVSLHPGIYYTYFVLSKEEPIQLARTVVVVRKEGELLTFRRFTNFAEPEDSSWHYVRGNHIGFVVERSHWLYFLGFAEFGIGEPSILAAQWLPISPKLLIGSALVGGDSGPESFPIIIEPTSTKISLRQALKNSVVINLSSDELNVHVRNVICHKIRQADQQWKA